MNLDRALAILGLVVGLLGTAAGVYVSEKDYKMGLLLASGWVAAALIGVTICILAFKAITGMERSHAAALGEMGKARSDAEQKADAARQEAATLRDEIAEFRNISRALSAVVNGEDKPSMPRPRTRRTKAASAENAASAQTDEQAPNQ